MKFAQRAVANHELLSHVALTTVNALTAWREARELTEKAFAYAEGGSWSYNTALRDALNNSGFPTLPINLILPRLLRISGNEREVRARMTAKPTQDGGVPDAEIATRLLEWCTNISNGDEEISKAFMHALVGRMAGWIEYYWSNKLIPLGAPYYRHINPYFVLPDPAFPLLAIDKHRFIIKTYWETSQAIAEEFPDAENEIQMVLGNPESQRALTRQVQDWWQTIRGGGEELRQEFTNVKENTFRIIEMQERRNKQEHFVVNVMDGRHKVFETREQADEVALRIEGLESGTRVIDHIVTITTLADYVLLQEEENEVQDGLFTIRPVGGYDLSGRNFTFVEQLFGVQEEKERSRSSMLYILHTTAHSGWTYPDGALDPDMEARLEIDGAAPGLILKYKQGYKAPEKIQSNPLPPGEVERSQLADADADRISSIGPGELGQPEGQQESGILHAQRTKEATTTLRPLFDGLNSMKRRLAPSLLTLMKQRLSPQRIARIVGEEVRPEDLWQGEHEIIIVPGTSSESQRLQRLVEADTVIARMPPDLVPWHLFFGLLDWPDKDGWIEYIQSRLGISQANQNGLAQQVAQLKSGLQQDVAPEQATGFNNEITRTPQGYSAQI